MGFFSRLWGKKSTSTVILPSAKTKRISKIGVPPKSEFIITCEIVFKDKPLSTIELSVNAANANVAKKIVDGETKLRMAGVRKIKKLNKK
jgi:hypothetical protein